MERFDGRVGVAQMALSRFRIPVVEMLARACDGGLCVFAGRRRADERVDATPRLTDARYAAARNVHFGRGPLEFCWQRGMLAWLADWDPDALVVDANPRWITTRVAARWMHRRRRPILGWGLGVLPLSPGLETLRQAGRRRFVRLFDGMIAYSTRAADDYAALGVPVSRIFVAHNACTPRPTAPPPTRPATFGDRATILFVGRLLPGKRVDLLIEACADLPAEMQPRLRIVGDGPERTRLVELARDAYPATEFLGARFGAELDPIFSDADLFVLPGLGGLAIQEAMAHALPVVVAEGDGTQVDLVTDANGWNVPPGDPTALRTAITDALTDPAGLRRMGEASYRIVAGEINIETMVESIVHALREVVRLGPRV